MILRVMPAKRLQLTLQILQLLVRVLWALASFRRLQRRELLTQQRIRERLFLLSLVKPLRSGFQLRRRPRQKTEVGLVVFRKLPDVTSLEGSEFCILVIEFFLCFL